MNYDEYDKLCEILEMEPRVYSYQSYNIAKGGSGKGMFGQAFFDAYPPLNPTKVLEILKLLRVDIDNNGKWILFSEQYHGQHEDFNKALTLLCLEFVDKGLYKKELKEILDA